MGKGVYDTNSPHFKGTFLTIYAVNQKYPAGGVDGDWCLINGWAHYWDADRGTWCVNSQRDTYWDELFSGVKFNTENIMKKYEYLLFDLSKKANTSDVQASLEELKKEIGDRTVIEGNVTNLPDEEDITSGINESGTDVLSFKDRVYNPLSFSGKGYKILRKNIKPVSLAVTKIIVGSIPTVDGAIVFTINGVEVSVDMVTTTMTSTDLVAQKIAEKLTETMTEYEVSKDASTITLTRKFGGKVSTLSSFSAVGTGASCIITDSNKIELRNILTQIMMNQPNTIYEIRYDFDLNGETIEMQEGCALKFEGGSINGAGSLIGDNTSASDYKKIAVTLKGTWLNKKGLVINNYFRTSLKSSYNTLDLCFPFGFWQKDTDVSSLVKNVERCFSNGFNSIGIILGIGCTADSTKAELYPDLDKILSVVKDNAYPVSYLKFHIDGGIWKQTKTNTDAFKSYCSIVLNTIDRAKDIVNFPTVYIINEWMETSNKGMDGSMKTLVLDLIEKVKEKGFETGIAYSMRNYWNADEDVFKALDKPSINYYPTMTYLDDKVQDCMDFTNQVYSDLSNYVCVKNALDGSKKLYITESGCPPYTGSLRAPFSPIGDKIEGHSPQMHVFLKSMLNNVTNKDLDISSFSIWYGDEIEKANIGSTIKNLFYE